MKRNHKFDTIPAKLPERFERPTLSDTPPGSIWPVPLSAVWVDEEYNIWINGEYPVTHEQDTEYEDHIAKIIRIDEGFILDLSLYETSEFQPYFDIKSFEAQLAADESLKHDYLPVIFVIATRNESTIFKKIFKNRYDKPPIGETLDTAKPASKPYKTKRKLKLK